jgi:hypothetical protein
MSFVFIRFQPWTSTTSTVSQATAIQDEDEYEEVIDGNPAKRIKFDDELEEIVAQITKKYPVGHCNVHPEISCFYHRPAELHFELNRPRCLVWAAAIVSFRPVIDPGQC